MDLVYFTCGSHIYGPSGFDLLNALEIWIRQDVIKVRYDLVELADGTTGGVVIPHFGKREVGDASEHYADGVMVLTDVTLGTCITSKLHHNDPK